MRVSSLIGLFVAGAVLTAAASAHAGNARRPQNYTSVVVMPRGLYLGAGFVGTKILHQEGGVDLLDDGGGLTLFTGMRLNRTVALELGWMATLHNPETVITPFGDDVDFLVLNAVTGDAKIYVPSESPRFEPYVQGGIGAYFLDSNYFGTQSVGSGFQLGGGFDLAARRNLLLGLRALYRGMAMRGPDDTVDDTFVSAVSLEANLTLRF
jgi:hypothetical protein